MKQGDAAQRRDGPALGCLAQEVLNGALHRKPYCDDPTGLDSPMAIINCQSVRQGTSKSI
ncbi:hypothetical protein WME95_32290 [Sorangium sp. So ce327]|jgi:hypothetical protein|uniref:hypothetical protein n=1 Tax=unclassified Sorangium TaxID=2621164 RepID=UPI003F5E10E9